MSKKFLKIFAKAKEVLPEDKPLWSFDPTDDRKYFFMHVPKTAGTTFRKMLHRHAPKNYLWPDQQFLKNNGNRYPSRKNLLSKYNDKLTTPILSGHYGMDLLPVLSEDIIILTFIRNPYERILSHIKHICALDKEFRGDPNLVLDKKFDTIMYVQSKMLRFRPHNREGAKKLLESIDRINFIGLTEEFDRSIALCNKMFNWKLELIEPQNQRKEETIQALTPKNKTRIIHYLIPEIRAYSNAHLKFESLCEEYGV